MSVAEAETATAESIFAALAGFFFPAERIGGPTVAGFVIILVGFVLVKRRAIQSELRRHVADR